MLTLVSRSTRWCGLVVIRSRGDRSSFMPESIGKADGLSYLLQVPLGEGCPRRTVLTSPTCAQTLSCWRLFRTQAVLGQHLLFLYSAKYQEACRDDQYSSLATDTRLEN